MRERLSLQGFYVGQNGHVYTDYTCTTLREDLDPSRNWLRYTESRSQQLRAQGVSIPQRRDESHEEPDPLSPEEARAKVELYAFIATVRAELAAMQAKVL